MRMRRKRGTTVLEVLVTLAVLSVLTTLVFEVFRTGVTLQVRGQVGSRIQDSLWIGYNSLARELPEAQPIFAVTGQLYLLPGGMRAEAVQVPARGATSDRLEFLQVDPNRVDPLQMESFLATEPGNYRRVAWFARDGGLYRQVFRWNATSSAFDAAEPEQRITGVPDGTVTLSVTSMDPRTTPYVADRSYRIVLTAVPADRTQESRKVSGYVHLNPLP